MSSNPIDIVKAVLADPTNLASVSSLVAPDATYVSLNYENPELKKVMPWAGTGHGPEGIVDTFIDVGRCWEKLAFEIREIFGSGENVAVFGSFTYRSTILGRVVTTPFSILCKVVDAKVTHMQFMEDTFATAMSFRIRGEWRFRSHPEGDEVVVGTPEG